MNLTLLANGDLERYDPSRHSSVQQDILRVARNLYMRDTPFERIFILTGLPVVIFNKFKKKWDKLKDKVDAAVIEKIRTKAIGKRAEDFVNKGVALGEKFIDRLIRQDIPISVKDFKLIMDAVQSVHRVGRLEKGESTEIQAYQGMRPDELREYLVEVQKTISHKHRDILEVEVFEVQTENRPDYPVDEKLMQYLPAPNGTTKI